MATAPPGPAQALNPQPQTTAKSPAIESFIAHSFPGNVPQYATSFSGGGAGWGQTVNTALVGASGFYRRLRVKFTATGGVNGTVTVADKPDAVFSTAPGTVPALNVQVDADFWWNPDDPALLPNGLGSSRQWGLNPGTPGVSNGSSQLVTFPKPGGGQIESLTFVCRDSTGARTDTAWPSRVQLAIDNTTYLNIDLDELIEDAYNKFQFPDNSDPLYNGSSGVDVPGARPVGVLPISFRDSVFQVDTGLDQTGLTDISTTPGTSIQLGGTGWRNVDADANSPYQITLVAGLIVPAGTLVAS